MGQLLNDLYGDAEVGYFSGMQHHGISGTRYGDILTGQLNHNIIVDDSSLLKNDAIRNGERDNAVHTSFLALNQCGIHLAGTTSQWPKQSFIRFFDEPRFTAEGRKVNSSIVNSHRLITGTTPNLYAGLFPKYLGESKYKAKYLGGSKTPTASISGGVLGRQFTSFGMPGIGLIRAKQGHFVDPMKGNREKDLGKDGPNSTVLPFHDGDEILRNSNIYARMPCDPRGRIPTASQGRWCVGDWLQGKEGPDMTSNPFGASLATLKAAMGADADPAPGDARFYKTDKEYPLNNLCITRLPSDWCKFSTNMEVLPDQWKHAYVKVDNDWWNSTGSEKGGSVDGGPASYVNEPYGHGKMLKEKSQLYSSSIDQNVGSRSSGAIRMEDSSLQEDTHLAAVHNQSANRQLGTVREVESVSTTYVDRAKDWGRSTEKGHRPDSGLVNFWIANPDSMWINDKSGLNEELTAERKDIIAQNQAGRISVLNRFGMIINAAKGFDPIAAAKGSSELWSPPSVVFDDIPECCGNNCVDYINKPFCVTEAQVRRYYEQVDHLPNPNMINCAASDGNICDSIHGDSRDQDDHWGKGWLEAMRGWNSINGPMPSRESLQREKIDILGSTNSKMLESKFGPTPEYLPPEYDPSAHTTSYAAYSVGDQAITWEAPTAYRQEPMNEDLKYNTERNFFLKGFGNQYDGEYENNGGVGVL